MVRIHLWFALDTVFTGTFFYCVLQAPRENFLAGPAITALLLVSIRLVLVSRSWLCRNRTINLNFPGGAVLAVLAGHLRAQSNGDRSPTKQMSCTGSQELTIGHIGLCLGPYSVFKCLLICYVGLRLFVCLFVCLLFIYFKDFIYLFMRDTQRERSRDRGRQRSTLHAGSPT